MEDKTEVEEFREIAAFLEEMTFKRTLFGVKKEEVFACMQDLNTMYQERLQEWKNTNQGKTKQQYEEMAKNLVKIKEKQEEMGKENIRQLSARDKQIESLTQYVEKYKTEGERYRAEKEESWGRIRILQEESRNKEDIIKSLQEEQQRLTGERERLLLQFQQKVSILEEQESGAGEFAEKSELLTKIMIEAQRTSDNHLEQAKRQAKRIIAEAKEEAIRISDESAVKIRRKEEEAKKSLSHLEHFKAEVIKNLKLIRSDISLIGNEAADLEVRIMDMPEISEIAEMPGEDRTELEDLYEGRRNKFYGIK